MGKLIRFAIVALVLYGTWQTAAAQWDFFKFRDAVRALVLFGGDEGDDALRTRIVAEGSKVGIQVEPARVSIRSAADHTYVDVAYTRPVQLLPWYEYKWSFEFKAESWRVPGGRIR
jgi:hypothetical protein